MASMQALLKIKADVEGQGEINSLNRAIGGLSSTADKVSRGFKGLVSTAGGLSSALGALVPLATGAGLVAMAKNAIDAADDMNDLSQKTGVSVEQLSKFQQAANASGTSIEGVGTAMVKLNKNLATDNSGAAEAMTALGISATDANGSLKSADQVMLEVADKFAKMEDGANKSAAAQALFGKSGADLIPLLNGGSKAITDLSATMSTKFAQGADVLNDKLSAIQGEMLKLGVEIGTTLMPALTAIADLVLGLASGFDALPGPVQAIVVGVAALTAAFVVLAPAISAVIAIAGALSGLGIGATIAGWSAAALPAITAISAAFTGFMAFLTGTILPGLIAFFSGPAGWTVLAVAAVIAMVALFHEPITEFLTWLGEIVQTAFNDLIGLLQPIFVQPFIDLWNNVLREPVTALFDWIGGYIETSMQNALSLAEAVFVTPWVNLWDVVKGPVTALFDWIGGYIETSMHNALALAEAVFVTPWVNLWNNVLREPVAAMISWLQGAWQGIVQFFQDSIIDPIAEAWIGLMEFLPDAIETAGDVINDVFTQVGAAVGRFFQDTFVAPITTAWTDLTEFLPNAMETAADAVGAVFTQVGTTIKNILNSILSTVIGSINKVINEINYFIGVANGISAKVGGPQMSNLPKFSVPKFAEGGVVNGPTLAMVGEGGEREYIIPQSKMAAASANFLSGARGGAVIPQSSGGGGGGNAQINVTTGPVLQQGGQQYVTMADLEKAMRKTADGVYKSLRTPSSRIAMGRA